MEPVRVRKPHREAVSEPGKKSGLGMGNTVMEITERVMEAYGELLDDAGRQYIYMGPRVLNPDYPDAGKLGSEEFKFGTKIDIKLKDRETGEENYSTVEFMRTSERTGLSKYIIVELYVYDK